MQGLNAMNQMQQGQIEAQQQQQLQAMRELQMQQLQEQVQGEKDARANITRFGDSLRGSGYQESDPIGKAMLEAGMVGDYLKMKKTNTADPYYTPQVTRDGRVARFNNRTGQIEYVDAGGQPVYAASQDPTTQGNIAYEKSRNKWETVETPTGAKQSGFAKDLIPMSKADEQSAIQQLNSQPGALTPEEYAALTGGAKSSPTVTGLTPGEKKAQEEAAKNTADATAVANKKQMSASRMLDLLKSPYQGKSIETLIDESTGSGLGSLRDSLAGTVGVSTEGSKSLASLKALQGWLSSNVPRMEGPQSDRDVNLYIEMTGKLADPFTPAAVKKESYKTILEIMDRQSKIQPQESAGGWKIERAD
jgi:hypothetical protein